MCPLPGPGRGSLPDHRPPATGHRYLHKGTSTLAAEAPALAEALQQYQHKGLPFAVLDDTLTRCDRAAGKTRRGTSPWYTTRTKHLAGNKQLPAAPGATPL